MISRRRLRLVGASACVATILLLTPIYAVAVTAVPPIIDDAGRPKVISTSAKRVVTLAPSLSEFIYAAGAGEQLVGVSAYSDFPEAARRKPQVADATGVAPVWFRPPYGTLSLGGVRAARRAGLRTVLWTAWGRDWRAEATPDSVVEDVLHGYVDGGTVLLHDSDCTSAPDCWHSALHALPALAEELRGRSLRVGPLGEHGISQPEHRAA